MSRIGNGVGVVIMKWKRVPTPVPGPRLSEITEDQIGQIVTRVIGTQKSSAPVEVRRQDGIDMKDLLQANVDILESVERIVDRLDELSSASSSTAARLSALEVSTKSKY